jgi:hypothetical protein
MNGSAFRNFARTILVVEIATISVGYLVMWCKFESPLQTFLLTVLVFENALIALGLFLNLMLVTKDFRVTPKSIANSRSKRSPMRGIQRFADFLGLRARKAVKALAADYEVEIKRLKREDRHWAVRWNIALAWAAAISTAVGVSAMRTLSVVLGWFVGKGA